MSSATWVIGERGSNWTYLPVGILAQVVRATTGTPVEADDVLLHHIARVNRNTNLGNLSFKDVLVALEKRLGRDPGSLNEHKVMHHGLPYSCVGDCVNSFILLITLCRAVNVGWGWSRIYERHCVAELGAFFKMYVELNPEHCSRGICTPNTNCRSQHHCYCISLNNGRR